jgi:excisionase family DNA binding protein
MTNNDGLLTTAELAELAGVSIPTIRFLRRAHMTPRAVFLGNSLRFPRAEAEAWVAAEGYKTRPTLSETIF